MITMGDGVVFLLCVMLSGSFKLLCTLCILCFQAVEACTILIVSLFVCAVGMVEQKSSTMG